MLLNTGTSLCAQSISIPEQLLVTLSAVSTTFCPLRFFRFFGRWTGSPAVGVTPQGVTALAHGTVIGARVAAGAGREGGRSTPLAEPERGRENGGRGEKKLKFLATLRVLDVLSLQ